MVKISFFPIFLSLFLFSCSSLKTREDQEVLRAAIIKGEFQKDLESLEKLNSYKKENSRILYFFEKGMALHLQGKYEESLASFENAREIYKALYTESLSKKIQTLLVNDNYDNYIGETYERSMIHYYLSLNHILLYQDQMEKLGNTTEIRQKLFSSRAEVLSWDNFLSEQIEEKKGESIFKNDLMARVYGAIIHEMISNKEDEQIALQLYKDARTLVFRNYNSYPSFNRKYEVFNKNFTKLHEIPESEIEEKYVERTIFQNDLLDFLNYKIILLTKKLRPGEIDLAIKRFKINKETVKRAETEKYPLNVSVLLERGIIPEKKAKIEYIPFGSYLSAMPNDKTSLDINNYGRDNIYGYAKNNLGFTSPPPDYVYKREYGYSSVYAGDLAISFEVPIINNPPLNEKVFLVIYDNNGNEIKSEKFLLISPIGDMAENALKEKESGRNLRIGLRLVSKYLAAIIASYLTYDSLKKNMSPGLASFLALTEFYIATKVISDLEKADLRYWATLPQSIFISNFALPQGEYRLKALIEDIESGSKVSYILGKVKVGNPQIQRIIKFRLLK